MCRENRVAMDKIVDLLLEKESVPGDEFRRILSEVCLHVIAAPAAYPPSGVPVGL